MKYRITHRTEYVYEEPASLCYNEARLVPRSFSHPRFHQTCLSRRIIIEPSYSDYRERTDFFGNHILYFTIPQPHDTMTITGLSEVVVEPTADELRPAASPPWELVRDRLKNELAPATVTARQFVMNSPLVTVFADLATFAAPSFTARRPILEAAHDLMRRIYTEFAFVPGVTNIATPLVEVLRNRQGVCQDFAHLMVGSLRAQGLAARYVSGYIETLPPPGQERLVGADASHAWCALYVPERGWFDFDPTNNLIPTEQHITLGWGRDFADVTPLKGVFFSHGEHELQVSVDVARVESDVLK